MYFTTLLIYSLVRSSFVCLFGSIRLFIVTSRGHSALPSSLDSQLEAVHHDRERDDPTHGLADSQHQQRNYIFISKLLIYKQSYHSLPGSNTHTRNNHPLLSLSARLAASLRLRSCRLRIEGLCSRGATCRSLNCIN
jgi:hypothetical protein